MRTYLLSYPDLWVNRQYLTISNSLELLHEIQKNFKKIIPGQRNHREAGQRKPTGNKNQYEEYCNQGRQAKLHK